MQQRIKRTNNVRPKVDVEKHTRNNQIVSGVLILTLSNLLVKVIGLLFKIPLTNIIGDEGMGYFNAAYRIYTWFYMVSTAGLPVALSIMISESRTKGNVNEVKKIYRITMTLFIVIGFVGMAAMIIGSRLFAVLIGSESIYMCIITIAPTLFFICISSAIRGFFQGYQNMIPTAISQVFEAVGKLSLGIILAFYAINSGYDVPMVAAYAISGLTIGAAAGMLFLLLAKGMHKGEIIKTENQSARSSKTLLYTLAKLAIPITISASVMSLTDLIDVMIIMRQLQNIGFSEEAAVAIYGNYTSLAVPMFNLPPILIYPISYSIIPLISSAMAAGDESKATTIMNSALKIAAIISIPASLGMSVLSKPILTIFYKSASVDMAAPLLSILSLSVFFIGMLAISNAILQARGLERKPIISMTLGAIVKLISSTILIGIPSIGINGAPIGTFLCYLTITVINFHFIIKHVPIDSSMINIFIKPVIASVCCIIAAILTYVGLSVLFSNSIAVIGAIGIAAIVYIVVLFIIKGIKEEDILMLPKGKKIYSLVNKLNKERKKVEQ